MLDCESSNESATETETTLYGERCNVKVVDLSTYFYSEMQIAFRGANHFPMQASSHEECKIKD